MFVENQDIWLLWEQLSLRDRPNIMGVSQIPVKTLLYVCESLDLTLLDFKKLDAIEKIMFPYLHGSVETKRERHKKENEDKWRFKRRKG